MCSFENRDVLLLCCRCAFFRFFVFFVLFYIFFYILLFNRESMRIFFSLLIDYVITCAYTYNHIGFVVFGLSSLTNNLVCPSLRTQRFLCCCCCFLLFFPFHISSFRRLCVRFSDFSCQLLLFNLYVALFNIFIIYLFQLTCLFSSAMSWLPKTICQDFVQIRNIISIFFFCFIFFISEEIIFSRAINIFF